MLHAILQCSTCHNSGTNLTEKSEHVQNRKNEITHFNGNLKEYIQFKSDFTKYVLPEIDQNKAAFILKSCLETEPLKYVKNIEDSLDLIWNRLDEKYGQPSMLAELVMNEIKRYKSITDADDKGLVDFIELIEGSYNNLKLVDMQQEISNLSVVSLIEEKLPNMIRRKWAEEVTKEASKEKGDIDKHNPFPCLFFFIYLQKNNLQQKRLLKLTLKEKHKYL